MQLMERHAGVTLTILVLLALFLAACGTQVIEEVKTTTPGSSATTGTITQTSTGTITDTATVPPTGTATPNGTGSLKVPHPILSDVRVRRAIAYCTNREELIQSVYPFLDANQRQRMLMDTFIPQGHWALATEGITTYPFDPEQGKQLLDEAGWKEGAPGEPRVHDKGETLTLKYTTTDAQFRVTYSTVLEQQLMDNCGIQVSRTHAPASWWFGESTGLTVRDFELGAYAWVGQPDPAGQTLYACNQIPLPENNWDGQNYMGWCNEKADKAIVAANNTIEREQRKEYYAIAQQEFTRDMVSLPLFNRYEAAAATNNLVNFAPDVTEFSYVTNISDWELKDGGDTVIIGLSQEPSTFFAVTEESSVTQLTYDLVTVRAATGQNYDYQPVALKQLPTVESGSATLEVVDVKEGDMVWNTQGEPVALAPGVEVMDANGNFVTYESGTLKMEQLTVNFELVDGLTWEDGEPVKKEDIELAQKINCDPETGVVSMLNCDSEQSVDVTSDTTFTITYLPGVKGPSYMVLTPGYTSGTGFNVGAYPAHRVLPDGRTLADVPAKEWATLPEVAKQPLSYGPYRLVEWQPGQRMVFDANPHFYLGEPKIKHVIVQFFSDTNAAVNQLITGDIDVVGNETLGAGAELERIIQEGEQGTIQVFPLVSATWEHLDMNLFVK